MFDGVILLRQYVVEVVLALTGASGSIYGTRLLSELSNAGLTVRLIVSTEGRLVLRHECQTSPEELAQLQGVILEENNDLAARSASGSADISAMVIAPASSSTIGKLAAGISDNLVTRSGMVGLKERRKLILVPRETPLSVIHLENMTRLSKAGAVILPASPGFYHHPKSVDDLVDFVVARILDQLGVSHSLTSEWKGDELSLDNID